MQKYQPFSFNKAEESYGFLLWQTTITWQRIIRNALEPYNISHAEFVIMASILWFTIKEIDITQISIANHSKLDKMTISKSLKKLVNMGYVNRVEHKEDSRAKNVSLTTEGIKLISKLVIIVEDIDKKFFAKLTKNEKENLISTFKKLI